MKATTLYNRPVFAAVTLLLFILGCSDSSKEELFHQGLKLIHDSNPRSAAIFFQKALEKDQNYFEARFELAKTYYILGKFESAEKELKKVKSQNPALRDISIELAKTFLRQSKPDEALGEVERFIYESSNDPEAYEIAGIAHELKRDYDQSVKYLKKAISIDQKRTAAGVALAKVYMDMGMIDKARKQIEEMRSYEPKSREVLFALVGIQMYEKNLEGAMDTYTLLVKEYPLDPEVLYLKGLLHIEKGDLENAVLIGGTLIKSFPKRPEGYQIKGILSFHEKNYDEAIISLQKSIALQPNPLSYYYLGICHYWKNELEQALSQFHRALDLNPFFAQSRTLISLILLRQKRIDDAIYEIKQVMQYEEKNAFVHNILGSAYIAKGMYAEGIEELNRALELNPKMADVHLKKGLYSLSRGKEKEAEAELRAAVTVAPEVLDSRIVLASYYMRNKEYQQSLKTLQGGLKNQPQDALLYNLIAEIYIHQSKIAEAEENYQSAKKINPQYYASYFNLASLYLAKGETEKSLNELQSILDLSPNDIRALISSGGILESTQRDQEAYKRYERARKTGQIEGFLALAQYHVRKGSPEQALKILADAIDKHPSVSGLYEFRGELSENIKKYKDAIETYETLERIDKEKGFSRLVKCYVSMGKPEKAIDKIKRVLKDYPDRYDLMAQVSSIYLSIGKSLEAHETAQAIIRRNPESPFGYIALARVHKTNDESGKAIALLKNAPCNKDTNFYMTFGDVYESGKLHDLALEQYRLAERIKPGYIPALFQQAAVLHGMNKKQGAIDQYLKVLRLSQDYIPALNNLAYLYGEDNRNLLMALQLATRAYMLNPRDGYVQDTYGYILLKNRKVDEGLRVLQMAAVTVTNNPAVYYHLAIAYKEKGNPGMAIENLQKALSFGSFSDERDARELLNYLKKG